MPKDILLNGASPMKFRIAVVFAGKQKKKDFKQTMLEIKEV
jgi:hypothetical protein